jgi:hypothetical protein
MWVWAWAACTIASECMSECMIDYRAEKEGKGLDLSQGLVVTPLSCTGCSRHIGSTGTSWHTWQSWSQWTLLVALRENCLALFFGYSILITGYKHCLKTKVFYRIHRMLCGAHGKCSLECELSWGVKCGGCNVWCDIHMHLWIDQQVLEMYLFCLRWKRGLHINIGIIIVRCVLFICNIDLCYLYTLFSIKMSFKKSCTNLSLLVGYSIVITVS